MQRSTRRKWWGALLLIMMLLPVWAQMGLSVLQQRAHPLKPYLGESEPLRTTAQIDEMRTKLARMSEGDTIIIYKRSVDRLWQFRVFMDERRQLNIRAQKDSDIVSAEQLLGLYSSGAELAIVSHASTESVMRRMYDIAQDAQ